MVLTQNSLLCSCVRRSVCPSPSGFTPLPELSIGLRDTGDARPQVCTFLSLPLCSAIIPWLEASHNFLKFDKEKETMEEERSSKGPGILKKKNKMF